MTDPATLYERQVVLLHALFDGQPKLGIPGLPVKSAAAAIGNATRENWDRSVTLGAKDHGSDGLFQWRLGRLTEMKEWCTKNFGEWDDIKPQAAFFAFECMRDYPELWKHLVDGDESLDTLTANICDQYERPSKAGRVLNIRIKFARDFLKKWGKDHAGP